MRVPGAEYDRDPHKIEFQARLITCAPRMLALGRALVKLVDESAGDAPPELQRIAEEFAKLDRHFREAPSATSTPTQAQVA